MSKIHYCYIYRAAASLLLALACTVTTGCKSDDDADDNPAAVATQVKTINVDVILPKSVRQQWQNSIDWAMTNIRRAQNRMSRQVQLNLRYHDEDTENLEQLAYRLTTPDEGDDTCHAIIGPYHSSNAQTLLNYAAQKRLPVVMPTCTSSELQRIHARNTYAWFLTESDVTQCEIMLSAARSVQANDVALIFSDDNYGKSFEDWFGYYATEFHLNVAGEGQLKYTKGTSIEAFLKNIDDSSKDDNVMLCVAVSSPADYADIHRQLSSYLSNRIDDTPASGQGADSRNNIFPLYADTSCDDEFIGQINSDVSLVNGITPSGSLDYGFPQAYYATYGRRPHNGEAQVYDALSIIALGAFYQMMSPDSCIVGGQKVAYSKKPYGPGLTDYMRAVVSRSGYNTGWEDTQLSVAFDCIFQNNDFELHGATGSLEFDNQTFTKVLNTTYMLWQPTKGEDGKIDITPLIYLSTAGTSSQASTTNIWEQEKRWIQENFDVTTEPELPEYQLLRDAGYDDDHIVLIVEDNLYNNEHNKYPGKIYVEQIKDETDLDFDVREDAVVDYHFSQITREDVADIMLGRQSDRLPKVIHPTETSNVFFFWSGHGGSREGPLWGNEDASEYFGTQRIHDIVEQMARERMYRRMMFAIETCYSGTWGEALKGQPNVLCITAANNREMSDADIHDQTLGVFLSNAFARTFRREVGRENFITIYDLYKELARTTIGSHVTLYNQEHYGSVYTNTMQEYFPH